MYETFSALAGRLGAPYARKLAVASIRMAGAFESALPPPGLRRTVMGLSFPSPVGLAAGFDKRGTLYPALPGLAAAPASRRSCSGWNAIVRRTQSR